MANKPGGSRTDTVVKLVLVFFIALLSFSVGTFVGKQVSDSEYQRAAIEEDYKQFRKTASVPAEIEANQKDALTDEDIESLTEEFVKTEKKEVVKETKDTKHQQAKPSPEYQKQIDKNTAKTAAYKQKIAEKSKPSKEAQRVAEGKSPTPTTDARKPTSVLPSVASTAVGKYTVQVASYVDENEAKAHAKELKTKGWSAFYMPAEVNGKTWYRVSLGLFSAQDEAKSHRSDLMKKGVVKTAIIRKIAR